MKKYDKKACLRKYKAYNFVDLTEDEETAVFFDIEGCLEIINEFKDTGKSMQKVACDETMKVFEGLDRARIKYNIDDVAVKLLNKEIVLVKVEEDI